MDKEIQNLGPDFKLIYSDLIDLKFSEKKIECKFLLEKDNLSILDIIELNQKLFKSNRETEIFNQRHKFYSKKDILNILKYQQKTNLSNVHVANYFKMSRNTISKWKKIFADF